MTMDANAAIKYGMTRRQVGGARSNIRRNTAAKVEASSDVELRENSTHAAEHPPNKIPCHVLTCRASQPCNHKINPKLDSWPNPFFWLVNPRQASFSVPSPTSIANSGEVKAKRMDPRMTNVMIGRNRFWKRCGSQLAIQTAIQTRTTDSVVMKRAIVSSGLIDHRALRGTKARNTMKKRFSCRKSASNAAQFRMKMMPLMASSASLIVLAPALTPKPPAKLRSARGVKTVHGIVMDRSNTHPKNVRNSLPPRFFAGLVAPSVLRWTVPAMRAAAPIFEYDFGL